MTQQFDNTDGRLRGRKAQQRRLRLWTANPCCAQCKRLTDYPDGFQADHKIPLFKGGDDKEDNMQILCIDCHAKKTDKDLNRTHNPTIGTDGWPEEG